MATELPESIEEFAFPALLRDASGRIREINHAWLKLVEGKRSAWLGSRIEDHVRRESLDSPSVTEAFQDQHTLLGLTGADSSPIYLCITELPVQRSGERLTLCFARDMTPMLRLTHRLRESAESERDARLQSEAELKRLQRSESDLRRSVDARDQFVLVASHELKTPLTTLSLQLELVDKTLTGGRPQIPVAQLPEQIAAARLQVLRLGRLIDHVRDLSQLEDIPLQPRAEQVDLGSLAAQITERFKPFARAASSTLHIKTDGVVVGSWDRFFCERMLSNLISNAIKFGAGKPIDVRVEAGRSGTAVITVRDRGVGIPAEQQPKLFQKFERGVAQPEVEGLGLGLYIVRRFVEAHRGRIHLESEPGWGSVFWIELPELPRTQ